MVAPSSKPLVLFLCTGNSARSQIAEAILRDKASDRFEVASAGLEPKGIDPLTLRVLGEIGLPTQGLRSKSSGEFLGKVAVHYAIILCNPAHAACPQTFPFPAKVLRWPFEDPADHGDDADARLEGFRAVRDLISSRIDEWLEIDLLE